MGTFQSINVHLSNNKYIHNLQHNKLRKVQDLVTQIQELFKHQT